jgi:protein-disulfide isomerase
MEKDIRISKIKLWQIISIILLVISLALLFIGDFKKTGNVISEKEASESIAGYLNSLTGGGITLSNSRDLGNIYEVNVLYQGQAIPVFITKDGKYFIQEAIPMSTLNNQAGTPTTQTTQPPTQITIDETMVEKAPYLGSEDAPVTIIDFSDYQCGFCERHHFETFPLIKQDYIDTGKVKYVFMDYISVGNIRNHEAAKCVRELGGDELFFKMHDELYNNQRSLNDATLINIATELGISETEFTSCLNSGKYKSQIESSTAYGRSLGIGGTPGFIINGILVSGAQPYSVFQQTIEQELSKEEA